MQINETINQIFKTFYAEVQ